MHARFVVVAAAVSCLSATVTSAANSPTCEAYDGAARAHCRTYCDVRQCNVNPHPSCDELRKNFAKKTGTTIFPCDVTATATPAATVTPVATVTPIPTATPTETATAEPSPTATATPLATACPDVLQLSSEPGGVVDIGWKGFAHGLPTGGGDVFTVDVTECTNATPPCGVCSFSGPTVNVGAGTIATQRCLHDTSVHCTADADCSIGAPCVFLAGAPQPLSAGGTATCVTTQIADVGGTVDVESGATIVNLALQPQFVPGPPDHPCPRCVGDPVENDGVPGGTCDDGLRMDLACDANASSAFTAFGETSLDCPPAPTNASTETVSLQLTTDTATRTLTSDSPTCRDFASTSSKCFCDTCNTGQRLACASNADCPDPAGPIGPICGGTRCSGGPNFGLPCTDQSECPAGVCSTSGEPTKPNRCDDDTCTETSDDHGTCAAGPALAHCVNDAFLPCLTDADCTAGDTCGVSENIACFPDNGVLGASISVGGVPDPLGADLMAAPTLVGLTCLAGTNSAALNSVAGLPGLVRIDVPFTIADPTATP
jgi:hypothetical protein